MTKDSKGTFNPLIFFRELKAAKIRHPAGGADLRQDKEKCEARYQKANRQTITCRHRLDFSPVTLEQAHRNELSLWHLPTSNERPGTRSDPSKVSFLALLGGGNEVIPFTIPLA